MQVSCATFQQAFAGDWEAQSGNLWRSLHTSKLRKHLCWGRALAAHLFLALGLYVSHLLFSEVSRAGVQLQHAPIHVGVLSLHALQAANKRPCTKHEAELIR